jgi:outer membrane receptor protein involved in Fe transport
VCGDPACFPGTPANQNVDESRRQGIEATFKGKYDQYLDGVVNYTFTEATFEKDIQLNPFFVGPTPFIENVQKGDSFPLVPKHRLGVTGNFHPTPEWTLSVTGLYVSTQFFLNDSQNVQPRLPGYFALNGRVSYERAVPGGRLTGFVMVNNILDQKYFTSGIISSNVLTGGGAVERFVVPAPGIAIYGGLSYRFESF